MAKSRAQRLITKLLPATLVAEMEAESRRWLVRRESCGFEQSIWELGGVRWKAKGASRTWQRCPNCSKRAWQTMFYRDPAEPATGEWDVEFGLNRDG